MRHTVIGFRFVVWLWSVFYWHIALFVENMNNKLLKLLWVEDEEREYLPVLYNCRNICFSTICSALLHISKHQDTITSFPDTKHDVSEAAQ